MTPRLIGKAGMIAALSASLLIASTQAPFAQQPEQQPVPGAAAPVGQAAAVGQGRGRGAVDPRVQQRTYLFADTNEQLPYAVFVSSKVSKDRKNPRHPRASRQRATASNRQRTSR